MTPQCEEWPVIVIGAGPTGLTLAGLLAQYGVRVLLVERNTTTVQEPRAVSIDDEALRTMQAVGIVDEVLRDVVLGYGSHYFSARGKLFLSVLPRTSEYGFPRRNAFHQPELEAKLRDHISAQPSGTTWFGSELIGFQQKQDCVIVQIKRPDGSIPNASCTYLVGCDGAKSLVRQILDIQMTGSTFRERWLIIDLFRTNDDSRDTKVFCDPSRPCITLPDPSGTRRFEFMLHAHESDEDALASENVANLLRRYSKDETCPIRRKAVYTFHARIAEKWKVDHVFLAGDAAHLSPPFAGQGMNSGLRDAHNLAWKLAAVLQARLGTHLLDSYEAERRDHASDMIRLAIRMGRVMMPRTHTRAFAMQTAFALIRQFPPLHDYFVEMKYKPKPRFHDGFFIKQNTAAPGTELVGRLFPQPLVRNSSSDDSRLDDVLGMDFALLAPPGTPLQLFEHVPQNFCAPLKMQRVAVVTSHNAPSLPPGVEVTMDANSDLLRSLSGSPPGLYFLRPDRYVAAFLPAAHFAPALKNLKNLIASTWTVHTGEAISLQMEGQRE